MWNIRYRSVQTFRRTRHVLYKVEVSFYPISNGIDAYQQPPFPAVCIRGRLEEEWFGVPCVLESCSSLLFVPSRRAASMYGEALLEEVGDGVAVGEVSVLKAIVQE